MASQLVDRHLVSLTAPSSMEAEQYQALRLRLEQLQRNRDIKVIAITSPGARDGKTVTAINLAGALAQDSRVLLIEADLRRPSIAEYLGLGDTHAIGLAQLVIDPERKLQDAIQHHDRFQFDTIAAGTSETSTHEVLRSPRLKALLAEARAQYDYVLVDTPPTGPVSDCALLARLLDGLLVVVSAHKTPRKQLEKTLNMLDGAPVLGLVFNRDDTPHFGYRRQDYRSYFGKPPKKSASSLSLNQHS